MASWLEEFEDLSAENGRQLGTYRLGEPNHAAIRASTEALAEFMRRYEEAGFPDRDTVMAPK